VGEWGSGGLGAWGGEVVLGGEGRERQGAKEPRGAGGGCGRGEGIELN